MRSIQDILRREIAELPPRVAAMCNKIEAAHPGRIQAFIYYGSSLREMDNPEKMLDFYVLVDSYRKTHANPLRAVLNVLIPPAVYYLEHKEDGVLSSCKYSILSLNAFERRCSGKALLSQVWGRFSQPCALIRPISGEVTDRIITARETAIRHIVSETAPLLGTTTTTPTELWARGFYESYRTELRPESSLERSAEIVERYAERYRDITANLYETKGDTLTLPQQNATPAKLRWFLRRLIGKPATAIRVINSAATFNNGLDYILRKLKNHSGVEYQPTPFERRHYILCSPVIGWKLWRKGAFR